VYGINVSLCYWTVARYETPNPARRDHYLDNAGHRDRRAQHRACMDGRLVGAGTGGRPGRVRTANTVVDDGIHIVGPLVDHLKPAFTLLAGKFQTDNPGATIDFDFATSSELANKLTQGASADIFASGDSAQMDTVVKADLTSSDPVNFASDTLVIVTAPGDPKQIRSFADLAKPDLRVAICQASSPCGSATQRIEDNTGVHLNPVSEESVSSGVLGKVTSGEADAGLVYLTDAHKAGDRVTAVKFPESDDAVNTYPIAILKHGSQPALAQKFVDLVTGATGQRVLTQAGFASP
jgi:molybdate transport system substrate-binding protein